MASITTATSGLSNATGTWTGGVVPVVGDKVTVLHPGTNAPHAGTQYRTGTAGYAVGATSFVLASGTGTIVAGECVQFQTVVGTDEDGLPVFDPTYYTVATGVTAAGQTLIIAAPGLVVPIPAAATGVVNRGHVVTVNATHVWGDDTSSLTPAANGVVISGCLRASRTASSSLTARGTVFLASGGTFDYGLPAGDPIPSGVTATLALNDSAALVAGKHGWANTSTVGTTTVAAGFVRTRNTRLANATAAAATSITVEASVGWAIGDRLVIGSDTDDATRVQIVTISAGAAPTWTVGAITNARLAGCRVGNLSSNVVIKSAGALYPSFFTLWPAATDTTAAAAMQDVRFEDMGSAASWVTVSAGNISYCGALNLNGQSAKAYSMRRIASEVTNTTGLATLSICFSSLNRPAFKDAAIYSMTASSLGAQFASGAAGDFDGVIYRCACAYRSDYSDASAGCVVTGACWTTSSAVVFAPAVALTMNNVELHTTAAAFYASSGLVTMNGGSVSAALLVTYGVSTSGVVVFNNVAVNNTLAGNLASTGNRPSQVSVAKLVGVNSSATDHRVMSYWQTTVTDAATRKRSTYAVKMQLKAANTATVYSFTLPALAGVAQLIKGSLRFDATYGTANPPRLDLSGQGVAQSFTCAAVANAWSDFALAFTPTSTGDITATVTVQSASITGFAWLDGVWHYPMTQSVRHFGYLWQAIAAQVPDSRITLTEAAALALPVAVNHGASTITVTGACTAREVFEACIADLCQTANQGVAVHIESATGAEFATTYTVALIGGAVSGLYTDAAGRHVAIAAPALVAGTRVQLWDVTGGAEVYNGVLAADGLALPATWTADHTIRLRADKDTKLPLQTLGVLSSSGLTFLDVQADDTVYTGNLVDGATCTEFIADGSHVQVDISDPDGVTSVQRLYAWLQWYQTTSEGIASAFFGAMTALDSASYVIDQTLADIQLDNIAAPPVRILGGYLARRDGSTIIAAASGSIQMDPGRAYVAPIDVLSIPPGERVLTMSASGAHLARG